MCKLSACAAALQHVPRVSSASLPSAEPCTHLTYLFAFSTLPVASQCCTIDACSRLGSCALIGHANNAINLMHFYCSSLLPHCSMHRSLHLCCVFLFYINCRCAGPYCFMHHTKYGAYMVVHFCCYVLQLLLFFSCFVACRPILLTVCAIFAACLLIFTFYRRLYYFSLLFGLFVVLLT